MLSKIPGQCALIAFDGRLTRRKDDSMCMGLQHPKRTLSTTACTVSSELAGAAQNDLQFSAMADWIGRSGIPRYPLTIPRAIMNIVYGQRYKNANFQMRIRRMPPKHRDYAQNLRP
jgi:hypothetical protein